MGDRTKIKRVQDFAKDITASKCKSRYPNSTAWAQSHYGMPLPQTPIPYIKSPGHNLSSSW